MPTRLARTATGSRLLRAAAIAACAVACSTGGESRPPAPAVAPTPHSAPLDARKAQRMACRPRPFAKAIPLKEASGAAYVPADQHRPASVIVVGDSGTRGAWLSLDPQTGRVVQKGRLPLDDKASDDLEGLSWRGDTLYGVTSSGYLRHWRRQGAAWSLVVPSYPIAKGKRAGKHRCSSGRRTNCGPNYEGLCLHQKPQTSKGGKRKTRMCVGFIASKARGTLTCLVERKSGRLSIEPSRVLNVAAPGVLSGCHFGPGGDLLWAGGNLFGGSGVTIIEGWEAVETATIRPVGALGRGFPEAIAVGQGGSLYRFSDTMTAPSLADQYKCE